MEIKLLKLVSGEEIIAQASKSKKGLILKDSVKILYFEEDVKIVPLHAFLEQKEIEIDKQHIVYEGNVTEEVMGIYNQQFVDGMFTESNTFNIVGDEEEE